MYKGQSLLGLMIALSLSVLLLLAMSHFYSRILGAQQQWSARLELQSELQRTIRLIAKELRRSGFRAAPKNTLKSNLTLFNLDERQHYVTLADNCLLFFYDRQQDGCVGSPSLEGCVRGKRNIAKNTGEDLIGYRLENKNLQLKTHLESDWDSCSGDRCRDFLHQCKSHLTVSFIRMIDKFLQCRTSKSSRVPCCHLTSLPALYRFVQIRPGQVL